MQKLLENVWCKWPKPCLMASKEMRLSLKQIPLSDSSAMRRTELLAEHLLWKLDQGLKNAPCISLAIDESTDMTDNAQLLIFVRYYDGNR